MFRFGPDRRVRKRSEYLRVQECGVAAHTRYHVLIMFVRPDNAPSRLGIVASKKVGGAVERNRGKRKVREWFRSHEQNIPSGVDLVVILKKGAPKLDPDTMAEHIGRVLPRLSDKAARTFASARDCALPDQNS